MGREMKNINRKTYWICIRNKLIYLHQGYRKRGFNYDPKICYVVDRQTYNRIDKASIKKRSKKKNNK